MPKCPIPALACGIGHLRPPLPGFPRNRTFCINVRLIRGEGLLSDIRIIRGEGVCYRISNLASPTSATNPAIREFRGTIRSFTCPPETMRNSTSSSRGAGEVTSTP